MEKQIMVKEETTIIVTFVMEALSDPTIFPKFIYACIAERKIASNQIYKCRFGPSPYFYNHAQVTLFFK